MSKLCGLNVVQLREELQKRSLVTSGNKEVLVARLREALINEGKNSDEFKFDGADEDNEISTGTFTTAKMMELLLSMSTEMKQIKEQQKRVRVTLSMSTEMKQIKKQSERQSERQTEELKQQTEELKQIKEQFERQTEELKQIKEQLKHVKLEVAEQIEEQSTRIEMIEQKLDRQTVEVDHKIDKLKRELEQSKKMAMPLDYASGRTLKAPAFDGEMSWNVYKTQLKAAATSNCWNGKERATALILALRGSAAEVLQTISAENHFNYEVLVSALDLRYGEETERNDLTPSIETKLPWIRLSKPFVIRNSNNPFSCQINENSRMPLRTVSLLNRQSKHQKVTYVYAKYMKNALARRWRKRREDDPVSRLAPSNEGAGKLIKANFVGQRLASRIDAPSTSVRLEDLKRLSNEVETIKKSSSCEFAEVEHVKKWNARKNNIIVFNLVENSHFSKAKDKEIMSGLFKALLPETDISKKISDCFRLGKLTGENQRLLRT
ncbi:hypothetical protein HELRODRAFT_172748 [Helobdella robusta]|uniref:SAP domain-containing protein n=1 Tax=Helobdella robusta TaxID=6412 RepID=T1F5W5_HELRO|nr:hypothetical protein HELRODRAFT_172748 [Helobdella robusta]ESO04378.1 hypothetical protein HELRODRAFT_172748 [Helobdella robusta]